MPETPTSGLAVLVEDVRNIVANSSTFQTLGGFADADEAKANVFAGVIDRMDEGDLPRPHAVVTLGETTMAKSIGTGALVNSFAVRQAVYVHFECDVPNDPETVDYRDAPQDAYVYFLNKVGALLQDIATCSQGIHTQIIQSVGLAGEVYKNDSADLLWHGVRLRVEVGLGR